MKKGDKVLFATEMRAWEGGPNAHLFWGQGVVEHYDGGDKVTLVGGRNIDVPFVLVCAPDSALDVLLHELGTQCINKRDVWFVAAGAGVYKAICRNCFCNVYIHETVSIQRLVRFGPTGLDPQSPQRSRKYCKVSCGCQYPNQEGDF